MQAGLDVFAERGGEAGVERAWGDGGEEREPACAGEVECWGSSVGRGSRGWERTSADDEDGQGEGVEHVAHGGGGRWLCAGVGEALGAGVRVSRRCRPGRSCSGVPRCAQAVLERTRKTRQGLGREAKAHRERPWRGAAAVAVRVCSANNESHRSASLGVQDTLAATLTTARTRSATAADSPNRGKRNAHAKDGHSVPQQRTLSGAGCRNRRKSAPAHHHQHPIPTQWPPQFRTTLPGR